MKWKVTGGFRFKLISYKAYCAVLSMSCREKSEESERLGSYCCNQVKDGSLIQHGICEGD